MGISFGLAGALAANKLLTSLLYQVSPTDGGTMATVSMLPLVVAGVATALPARASTRVDPVIALRTDT